MKAVFSDLPGVGWHRCIVHSKRNVLSQMPTASMARIAGVLKAIMMGREKPAHTLAEEVN